MILSLVFAGLCTGYGLFSLYMRKKNLIDVEKLEKMQVLFGNFWGNIMHLVFYSLFPLAVGIFLILQVILGQASL